jgi:hypothetical protein
MASLVKALDLHWSVQFKALLALTALEITLTKAIISSGASVPTKSAVFVGNRSHPGK